MADRTTPLDSTTRFSDRVEDYVRHDVDGTEDARILADASMDRVTGAKAFHWFDEAAARHEFARSLQSRGQEAICWNLRRLVGAPFLEGYEALLQHYGSDYTLVAEGHADDAHIPRWLVEDFRSGQSFAHRRQLDFESLRGCSMSSSYTSCEDFSQHTPMSRAPREWFDRGAEYGTVSFDYDTRIFADQPA